MSFCVDITLCLLHPPCAIETKYLSKVFYCQATRVRPGFNTNAQVDIHGRATPRIAYVTNLKKANPDLPAPFIRNRENRTHLSSTVPGMQASASRQKRAAPRTDLRSQ